MVWCFCSGEPHVNHGNTPPNGFFWGGAKTSQISSWFGRQASYSSSGIVTKSHKMKRLPRNDQSNWITFRGPKTHRWKTEGSFKISFILKVELLALILKKTDLFQGNGIERVWKGYINIHIPTAYTRKTLQKFLVWRKIEITIHGNIPTSLGFAKGCSHTNELPQRIFPPNFRFNAWWPGNCQ